MRKNSQSAGDNSILISTAGNVIVQGGLSVTEVEHIAQRMARDLLSGIQDDARRIAEDRANALLRDFISAAQVRLGEELEEKLAQMADPGAQFAYRSAQAEFCKYGDDEAKADSIDLLISRMSEASNNLEKTIIDDAISKCGRLSSRQMDCLCFYYMLLEVRFGTILSLPTLFALYAFAERYCSAEGISEADLLMMTSLGVISPMSRTRNWRPISEALKRTYSGVFFFGAAGNLWSSGELPPGLLIPCLRNPSTLQPNAQTLEQWSAQLSDAGVAVGQVARIVKQAEQFMLPEAAIEKEIVELAPKFENILKRFKDDDDPIRYYTLTPAGKAIAMARTRRDGWGVTVKLTEII